MAAGGFVRMPGGSVVVALSLPAPTPGGGRGEQRVRVLVHAKNRARALTRLRNLGLRAVYLRGNGAPPTPASAEQKRAYDPAKAAELLDDAGYEKNAEGKRV
ncbi:hypothetical protein ACWD44_04560, partial [Streptomyces albidoflavus]